MADSKNGGRSPPVPGGLRKVGYALRTAAGVGIRQTGKALSSRNTCKACGLGMGGQAGGMTNELGEFPAVCNKSVQAQKTDIQPAIPDAVLARPLAELRALPPGDLDHLGRLNTPLIKDAGDDRWRPATWRTALAAIAERFAACDPQRTFFYSSGRSSNEAGFVLQLFARLLGTNNINNCSYYCHQATTVGLGTTLGTGTATVELADLGGSDLIVVIGANPASNHPRFIHQLKACRDRGGEVMVINPCREPGLMRFAVPKSPASLLAGGSEIASLVLQPRIGGDVALLKGMARAVIEAGAVDEDFIARHCQDYGPFLAELMSVDWHVLETASGVARSAMEAAARVYGNSRAAVFAWGMGVTHHLHGVENVESIANLALLRAMVGRPHAGLLPLRGHSNVQGIGTIGVKPVLDRQVLAALEAHLGITLPDGPGLDTMAALEAAQRGAIDCALLMGGNLLAASPDQGWAEQALERVPFKVFLTTTLNRGHVVGVEDGAGCILPVTARDEEWQPTTQESMFNFVRLSDGGIRRQANARPETHVLADLGERLLGDRGVDFGAFRRHQRVREAIAATIPGMEPLATIDVARREFHIGRRILHAPQFATPSGRASFRVCKLPAAVADDAYPWVLASVRSEGQFNSMIYESQDSYRGVDHRWCVFMAPPDMQRLGLNRGDRVDLYSPGGTMRALEVISAPLASGSLLAYYPEANVLTGRAVDPRSRTPAFKSTPVRVEIATGAGP